VSTSFLLEGVSSFGLDSNDLDFSNVKVVLSSQLDSERSGGNPWNVEFEDLLVVVSMLFPGSVVDILVEGSVVERAHAQHDVKVAQSVLAHILSVLDDDLLDDNGSVELDLPPGLVVIIGVVER